MPQALYIGKVAKETGLSIDTIRFYEREGLMNHPFRSAGGFRVFDQDAVRDLKFIHKAQHLGFSLQEIRELLLLRRSNSPGCSHLRDLLRQHLGLVEAKIQELVRMEDELKTALRKCSRELKGSGGRVENSCPVMRELGRSNGGQEASRK